MANNQGRAAKNPGQGACRCDRERNPWGGKTTHTTSECGNTSKERKK